MLGIIPWLGVFFQSLWKGTREQRDTAGYNSLNGGRFQPKRMLLVWAVFIFVFFSISDSKLPSYILPIFPALALLIACYLDEADYKALAWAGSLVALPSAVALAFIPRVPSLAKDAYSLPLVEAHVPYLYAATLIFFVGGIAAIRLARQHKDWAVTSLAATAFVAGQLLMLGHDPQGRYSAGVDYEPALQAELKPETPIYLVGRYEQALPFYLRRTMTLVQHADEMEFGLKQEPQLWLPTIDAFVAQWVADNAAGKKDIAIIDPTIYKQLVERKLPMRLIGQIHGFEPLLIGQDPRRVIVANDPAPAAAAAGEKKAAK